MTGPKVATPDLVWYAAYGSNLCRNRFVRYLEGGLVPNSDGVVQTGARDPAPPLTDRPYEIDRLLYFAGASKTWGNGGVAYLDADKRPGEPALGRLWLITGQQFEDVYRQENRLPPEWSDAGGLEPSWRPLLGDGSAMPTDRPYGRLLLLDQVDDTPVITFTGLRRHLEPNPPHQSYLAIIARGIEEAWGLDAAGAGRYLARVGEG
ncbi:MAG: hypothetical protein O3C27_17370 [Actinomycetota bacterium]|nr:hypothetical protein [Actinomycetota bacterium]